MVALDTATILALRSRSERRRVHFMTTVLTEPLRRQHIAAAIELRESAADSIVLRQIPVAINLAVGCVLELHVGLEQAIKRILPGWTIGHADKLVQQSGCA